MEEGPGPSVPSSPLPSLPHLHCLWKLQGFSRITRVMKGWENQEGGTEGDSGESRSFHQKLHHLVEIKYFPQITNPSSLSIISPVSQVLPRTNANEGNQVTL